MGEVGTGAVPQGWGWLKPLHLLGLRGKEEGIIPEPDESICISRGMSQLPGTFHWSTSPEAKSWGAPGG